MELLKRLIMTAWDMWQHHTNALHEDATNRQGILEAEVNSQVQVIYDIGPMALGSSANTLLKRQIDVLLQLPTAYKLQWVATANIAKERTVQTQEGPYHSKRRQMQQWLIRQQSGN